MERAVTTLNFTRRSEEYPSWWDYQIINVSEGAVITVFDPEKSKTGYETIYGPVTVVRRTSVRRSVEITVYKPGDDRFLQVISDLVEWAKAGETGPLRIDRTVLSLDGGDPCFR